MMDILYKKRRAQRDSAKKLQNLDSMQSEVGPKGLHADIGSLKRFCINRHMGLAKKSLLQVGPVEP
jgi:hypothetical protein